MYVRSRRVPKPRACRQLFPILRFSYRPVLHDGVPHPPHHAHRQRVELFGLVEGQRRHTFRRSASFQGYFLPSRVAGRRGIRKAPRRTRKVTPTETKGLLTEERYVSIIPESRVRPRDDNYFREQKPVRLALFRSFDPTPRSARSGRGGKFAGRPLQVRLLHTEYYSLHFFVNDRFPRYTLFVIVNAENLIEHCFSM